MEPEKRPCITPRMIIGLAAIVLGVVFTLDNLGVLDAVRVLRFWPIVLVAIGVVRLTRSDRHTAGWIYLLIGAWLLIVNLHLVPNRYWSMWPLVLVAVGIAMVQRAIRGPREAGQAPGDAFVRGLAVLGGIEKRSASQEFRGGDVAAFMGGINIDLRQARIGAQDAVLEVFAMWGGVELKVPETWTIVNEVWPILGGVDDKTRTAVPDPSAPRQRLVIKGVALMGGIELKN